MHLCGRRRTACYLGGRIAVVQLSNFSNAHPEDYSERLETMLDASDLQDPLERDIERQRKIAETFCEWHKDPVRIARLYRWLDLRERTPIDVALFIESAASYQQDYDDLLMWSGER